MLSDPTLSNICNYNKRSEQILHAEQNVHVSSRPTPVVQTAHGLLNVVHSIATQITGDKTPKGDSSW